MLENKRKNYESDGNTQEKNCCGFLSLSRPFELDNLHALIFPGDVLVLYHCELEDNFRLSLCFLQLMRRTKVSWFCHVWIHCKFVTHSLVNLVAFPYTLFYFLKQHSHPPIYNMNAYFIALVYNPCNVNTKLTAFILELCLLHTISYTPYFWTETITWNHDFELGSHSFSSKMGCVIACVHQVLLFSLYYI